MPRGDGTGPMGMGPMTGRAAGYCAGYGMPGYMNPGPGRRLWFGRGRGFWAWAGGFGRGRRWRNMFYATGLPGWMRFGWAGAVPPAGMVPPAPLAPEQELQWLKQQAEAVSATLDGLRRRIDELEAAQQKA